MADDRHIYRPETPRSGVAVAAMFLGGLLFAVMALCTKSVGLPTAAPPLPASEVTLFRFAFGALVMLPLHGRYGINLLGADRRGLAWRGICGGFAVYSYFLSLQTTSLTHAVLLNYTSLIFAPLFAALSLGERVSARTLFAIGIAMAGIMLVTHPVPGELRIGDAYGLLSGILAGAAITSIRRLRRTETAWSIFFYLSIIGLPISLLACVWQRPVWPGPVGWELLLGMGVSSVAAQILMTYGYKYVRAAEGGVITLSQIVYSAVLGALWYGEPIAHSTAIGGVLILGAAVVIGLGSAVSRQEPDRSAAKIEPVGGRSMLRLEGKVCAITGGAGTIGRAMATRFAAEGGRVVIADRDGDRVRAVAAQHGWAGVEADVGREADAVALVASTVERYGRLDVLVNNAAAWDRDGPVTEVDEADWDAIQAATVKSVFLCCKHAIPVMARQGGGSILNIASVNGMFGLGLAAYSAAKGGVLALTRTLAAQHGAEGVRVNAISPGTVLTEAWQPVLEANPHALDEWRRRYLLHRVGLPEEVAALAAHLVSEEAANTTGANFVMDGGLSAGLEVAGYRVPEEREEVLGDAQASDA